MTSSNAVTAGGEWRQTKPYKFIVFVVGTLAVLIASFVDDGIDRYEWGQVITAGAGAAGVWLTANLPGYTRLKEATAAVSFAATLGVSWVTGGEILTSEWINLVIVGLAVVGVAVVGNPPVLEQQPAGLPDRGAGEMRQILIIVAAIVIGLVLFFVLRAVFNDANDEVLKALVALRL